MPRYDYRCESGHKYERQEHFGSPAEHPCDRCGKPARRLIVAPTVVFKSGGFYKTSGRSDSSSSGGETAKGVRSKTPPKKSDDTPSPSSSSTPSSTSTDD